MCIETGKCKVTKADDKCNHIDRWLLDFDQVSHSLRDPTCHDQPVIAVRYLQANYPCQVVDQIVDRLVDSDRGRLLVLCKSCEPFVTDNKLQVTAHDEYEPRPRICDYAVDPVSATPGEPYRAVERWEDHIEADGDCEGSTDLPPTELVLGRALHEFAPAVAALSDAEEMVLCGIIRYIFWLST